MLSLGVPELKIGRAYSVACTPSEDITFGIHPVWSVFIVCVEKWWMMELKAEVIFCFIVLHLDLIC